MVVQGLTASFRENRTIWLASLGAALAVALLLSALATLVDPAPPKRLRMATGVAGGAYAEAGEAFAAALAKHGVTLELLPTSGSVENIERLTRSPEADGAADVAIVQGGVGAQAPSASSLGSLGGVFYEPLWVFARADVALNDLRDLKGMRVAVGPEGGGTRAMLALLLAENGLSLSDLSASPEGGAAAAQALRGGSVEVAIFVSALDRAYVRDLIAAPDVRLISFARAEAYARRHRFLSRLILPEGVVDLALNVPGQDVSLIAPSAALVVRQDVHPALQSLLLAAAQERFRDGDALAAPGAFPSRDLTQFALTEEAERWFDRGGPTIVRRYLPFWAANLVERLWVLAIPALTLLYPLAKAAPPIYRWRIRRRIVCWYEDLRRLEFEGRAATDASEKARVHAELDRVLDEVGRVRVPLPYNDELYRLRQHIRFVDDLVRRSPLDDALR